MFRGDDIYGEGDQPDPSDELRRRLYNNYADPVAGPGPTQDLAPSTPAADFTPAQDVSSQEPVYQTFGDVAPSNESYQPQQEQGQLGYTNPEPPQPYAGNEGNDVTSGNPAPLGQPAPGLSSYSPVLGWDTGKLNSPDANSAKYQFMRAVQSAGLDPIGATNNPQSVANAVNKMYPGMGVTVNADGTINWPGLGPIDYSIDSGKGGWFFDPINQRGSAGPTAAATTAAAPRSVASTSYNPFASSGSSALSGLTAPQGLWNPEFTAQIRQLLMQRLQGDQGPVDENSTGIAQALTAARDETTRASDTERNKLAERLYATGGLNTDQITREIQQSGEKNAGALGTLRARLITQELSSRRDDMRSLLSMALQAGDSESARAIQLQLADLEAQLRRESLGVSLAEFGQQQNALAGNP